VSFAISSIHASKVAFFVGGFGEVEDTVALIVRTSRQREKEAPPPSAGAIQRKQAQAESTARGMVTTRSTA
jgi:hypothetical protein